MILISYSSTAISSSSCDNDEKLLTLATEMDEGLAVFSTLMSSSSFSNPSKKLIVGTGLLS